MRNRGIRNRNLLLTVCFFFLPHCLQAEEGMVAVLMRGPLPIEGIEFLPVNALQAVYGEYEYDNTETTVYFVKDEVFISDSWAEGSCGDYSTYILRVETRNVFYYRDDKGWSLFVSLDGEISEPCLFIAEFIRRFRYFQGITKDSRNISFPAILQFK